MTVVGSIRRPRDKRKTSLSFCYWLISQVRVGNWLTQWQRSHLSHHWQPTALSSSNFLQSHQIVAMIASSHPGSIFFSWQHAFPSTHLLFTASASKEYWRGEINVEFQVKGKKKSTVSSIWGGLTNQEEMMKMLNSEEVDLMRGKICKQSKCY